MVLVGESFGLILFSLVRMARSDCSVMKKFGG